jgi:hypothetical protein
MKPLITANFRKEQRSMAENATSADLKSSDPLQSVANALETAYQAAKDGSGDAMAAAENAIPAATGTDHGNGVGFDQQDGSAVNGWTEFNQVGAYASLCCVGRNSFWPPNPHLNREFLEKM